MQEKDKFLETGKKKKKKKAVINGNTESKEKNNPAGHRQKPTHIF